MASDTRKHLLDAALKLLSERGYDGTGVQEVVEAAGVTKPALYHHFGSKQGLLEALLIDMGQPFLDRLQEAASYTGDLPLTLDRVANVFLSGAAREPEFHRLRLTLQWISTGSDAHAAAERLSKAQQAPLEALFRAAAHDHGNMRGKHARYAYTFLAILNAYAALIANGQLRASGRIRRELVQQFSHGIYS